MIDKKVVLIEIDVLVSDIIDNYDRMPARVRVRKVEYIHSLLEKIKDQVEDQVLFDMIEGLRDQELEELSCYD